MAERKKLAIFCDGTWNDLSLASPTNVVRLAKCVASQSRDGLHQMVYYGEGVGVGAGVSFVTDTMTKFVGGALGRGLDRKIEDAYRFLVLNYCPGDDVYVFGFSRGAYTARSLCGMVRNCGILRRDCYNQVPAAMKLYRGAQHPDDPVAVEFRRKFAHPLATSEEDLGKLSTEAGPNAADDATLTGLYQYRPTAMYRIMFAGIWDTVGALGIPQRFDFLKLNRRHRFHDTRASSLLTSIRHAIAANEKRSLFDVTLFENIDDLNAKWGRATGWAVDGAPGTRFVPYAWRPYQQRWFPGDHCSVGGGYDDRNLSSGALLWIAEGATRAGLEFDWNRDELKDAQALRDPLGDLGRRATAGMPAGEFRAAGPKRPEEISAEAVERHARLADYRPPNLIDKLDEAAALPASPPPPAGFPQR